MEALDAGHPSPSGSLQCRPGFGTCLTPRVQSPAARTRKRSPLQCTPRALILAIARPASLMSRLAADAPSFRAGYHWSSGRLRRPISKSIWTPVSRNRPVRASYVSVPQIFVLMRLGQQMGGGASPRPRYLGPVQIADVEEARVRPTTAVGNARFRAWVDGLLPIWSRPRLTRGFQDPT